MSVGKVDSGSVECSAVIPREQIIKVWPIEITKEKTESNYPRNDQLSSNKFFRSIMLICLGTYERILYGWEVTLSPSGTVEETKVVFALPVHQGYVKSIATAGRHLVTGGTDEVIKVFDLRKKREQGTLTHHSGTITSLAFHSTTHLLTASSDSTIHLLRTKDWESLLRLGKHKDDSVEAVAMHPSGKLAVSVGKRDMMKVWDLQTGKQAAASRVPLKNSLVAEWDARTGDYFLLASDTQLLVFQASNLEVPMISKKTPKLHSAVFVYVHDRLFVVFGGEGARISYFAVDSHEKVECFDSGHTPRVKCLKTVEVGDISCLVSASSDGTTKLWNFTQILDEEPPKAMAEHNCDLRITCMTVSTI